MAAIGINKQTTNYKHINWVCSIYLFLGGDDDDEDEDEESDDDDDDD